MHEKPGTEGAAAAATAAADDDDDADADDDVDERALKHKKNTSLCSPMQKISNPTHTT